MNSFSQVPNDQYSYVKSLNIFHFLFQASNENIDIGTNLFEEVDIKEESEKFCDTYDDQANYSGTRWIVICLSTVFMLYRF